VSRLRKAVTTLGLGLWTAVAVAETPAARPPQKSTAPLLVKRADPHAFGTEDYSVTVLSATKFAWPYYVSPNLSAYCPPDVCTSGYHWYATVDLPAGTVIDYIGVNTKTTVDAAMGFTLHFRDHLGGTAPLASASFPAHDFATDLYGPLGILIPSNVDRVFVLDVELAPGLADHQFFGFVEIWWRRVVSDPPATSTFGDVPTSHPFFQYIEALAKSGITGGCGSGNFCPDDPLTRAQMAVFLSKALGLHWPN
jgi:hypothetical protein